MTKQARWAAAGLLAGLALATAATPVDAARVKAEGERVFPFEPGGAITIESQNGRVVVEAWDRPEVRVQITREVRAGKEAQARELLRQLSADVSVAPGHMRIVSLYPKTKKVVGLWDLIGQSVRALNIHYYLQVPRETSLRLFTSNGEVRVRGLRGALKATTTNGDVDVSAVSGAVTAMTTNGEIRLARLDGQTSAQTTNGSVAADVVRLPTRGGMEFETTNGNVTVTLPADLHANVEAATTNGRIAINYNVTTTGTISSKKVQGTVGRGGPRIRFETTNGNVEVGPPRARATRSANR